MTAIECEIFLALKHLGDLKSSYFDILERFDIRDPEPLSTLEHLGNTAECFAGFLKPMPVKPEGTMYKEHEFPAETELLEAGLSNESLSHLPGFIALNEQAEPQTEGAKALLQQIRESGAEKEIYSKVSSALALVEALDKWDHWRRN